MALEVTPCPHRVCRIAPQHLADASDRRAQVGDVQGTGLIVMGQVTHGSTAGARLDHRERRVGKPGDARRGPRLGAHGDRQDEHERRHPGDREHEALHGGHSRASLSRRAVLGNAPSSIRVVGVVGSRHRDDP
jgi:hypothetical protein